ncbi:MAG: hypothetical protein CMN82_11240 [Spongiibacter sp.]|nr:hypothetical protein [Spongiibacter sp.]MBI57691.1 hypothetical protein [Spongiibacter sp.]
MFLARIWEALAITNVLIANYSFIIRTNVRLASIGGIFLAMNLQCHSGVKARIYTAMQFWCAKRYRPSETKTWKETERL